MIQRLQAIFPWDRAEEVTFECEPGTLQQHKLAALQGTGRHPAQPGHREFRATRSSNPTAGPICRRRFTAPTAGPATCGFAQINIDLIAGMVGETWDNWRSCVRKTIELAPESVTIYQMELPYQHGLFQGTAGGRADDEPDPGTVADWPTKRAWVEYAFDELARAAMPSRAPTPWCANRPQCKFVYRDSLWHGADMFGTGVASFGHVSGVHVQNVDTWETYLAMLERGELPLGRALPVTPRQLLLREMMLQLKTGRLDAAYFQAKFGIAILEDFAGAFHKLAEAGQLTLTDDSVTMTRPGLLQVDRLLPEFFEPQHRTTRYT